jgi:hypothetical protein
MAFDVTQSVAELQASFTNWLAGIFGDESKALAFAQDPYGEFEEGGFTNQNLANLNVQQAVAEACTSPGVPSYVQENLSGYAGPAYSGPPTIEHVVEQVQEVTQIVYQNNTQITNEIQNNNTNIAVGDNFNGDIDVDNLNVDDGGVGNTGDGFSGQQNSGDNAVQNTGTIEGGVVAGNNDGINTGQGSNVENAVTGSGNTVGVQASADGGDVTFEDDIAQNFGAGTLNQSNNNQLEDSSLAVGGGDALTIEDSNLDGVGISQGDGDLSGTFTDNDDNSTNTETNTNAVTNSDNVTTEQGDGDQTDGADSSTEGFAV